MSLIKKAGWKVPKDHPDLDPPHEALQLLEHYREMVRLASVQKRPADFKEWLTDAENTAREFEAVLRRNAKETKPDSASSEKAYQRAHAACLQCHAKYRDVPQKPRAGRPD